MLLQEMVLKDNAFSKKKYNKVIVIHCAAAFQEA
jgi:hypothetical protein